MTIESNSPEGLKSHLLISNGYKAENHIHLLWLHHKTAFIGIESVSNNITHELLCNAIHIVHFSSSWGNHITFQLSDFLCI